MTFATSFIKPANHPACRIKMLQLSFEKRVVAKKQHQVISRPETPGQLLLK
jgi:hypothetical protein